MCQAHYIRHHTLTVLFLIVAVLSPSLSSWAQAGERGMTTVHIIGSSPIYSDNLQASREAAINNSLVAAVSRVLLDKVSAEMLLSHFQVISESVLSKTDKYIRDYKVLSESTHAKTHRTLVQASISIDQLMKALKTAGLNLDQKNIPRILLCVAEKNIHSFNYAYWWGGQTAAPSQPAFSIEALKEALTKAGYIVVESDAGNGSSKYAADLAGPEAVALARKIKAKIVIAGLAAAEEAPNTMGGTIRSFRGTVSVRVYRVDNGEQIGQSQRVYVSAGSDAAISSKEALLKAMSLTGEDVIDQIEAAGINQTGGAGQVEMVVEGTGGHIASFVKFRGALSTMSGVDNVRLKEMMADTAVVTVDYQGNARSLADALVLQSFDSFGINISEIGMNTIRLQLVSQ